jgi:hypothetical protein|nr:MAG TPA: hypothetical protein [Bacteriophage sp.]
MIEINELLVDTRVNKLIIDISVSSLCYYDNMWLRKVKVTVGDKVKHEQDISAIPEDIATANLCREFCGVLPTESEMAHNDLRRRRARLELRLDKINANATDLFLIDVELAGAPMESTPCGLDKNKFQLITYDEGIFYRRVGKSIGVGEEGKYNKSAVIDTILLMEGMRAAVRCGDVNAANRFWALTGEPVAEEKKKCSSCNDR